MNKILSSGLVVGAMMALSGCGGSSDPVETAAASTPSSNTVATGTAFYIDSAVSGVNYKCGTQEGITGADGSFTFEVGQSCTFYLGDMMLRGVDAGLLVDGESVYETDVKIARILQSLDSDGNPANGITIKAEAVKALVDAGITKLPDTVAEMDEVLAVIAANGGTEISEEDAMKHMLTTLLGGKTFYVVGQEMSDAKDIWKGEAAFNANLTEMTYSSDTEGTRNIPISLNGTRLVFEDDMDGSYSIIGANNGDYIEVTDYYSNGTIESHTRLYFDKTKADAYAESLIGATSASVAITVAMLTGNTFYDESTDEIGNVLYGKMTFTATESSRREISYNNDGSVRYDETFTFPVAIIDGKLRIDATQFGEGYMWFTLASISSIPSWELFQELDLDKDGNIDPNSLEKQEWYLSKPASFPASL